MQNIWSGDQGHGQGMGLMCLIISDQKGACREKRNKSDCVGDF